MCAQPHSQGISSSRPREDGKIGALKENINEVFPKRLMRFRIQFHSTFTEDKKKEKQRSDIW